MKIPSSLRRRAVVQAGAATFLSSSPTLFLQPLRVWHHLGDAPYYMGVGLCTGLALCLLVLSVRNLVSARQEL